MQDLGWACEHSRGSRADICGCSFWRWMAFASLVIHILDPEILCMGYFLVAPWRMGSQSRSISTVDILDQIMLCCGGPSHVLYDV